MAGSTPVLLVDDLRIVARLKLLAANHLPPNQERTPHAYYLFLSLWTCRFSLSLSLPFLSSFTAATKTRSSASSVFLLCTPYSQESMRRKRRRWRWQRPSREKKREDAGAEREESERASKKRERRLGLGTILQVRIGPELVFFFFFFLSFSFLWVACIVKKEGRIQEVTK